MVNSTQQSIQIAGIKDGVVILKNGGYRMIFQVMALNFALKSEMEQNSLIMQYQSFLNSLHFPIEITIRSRRLDLTPYIEKLKKSADKETNELIKIQTADYVDFIDKLINLANIMKKNFYVVFPYDPLTVSRANPIDNLFKKSQVYDHIKISDTEFKNHLDKLRERAGIVAGGLGSMGLHCQQLSTEQLIELFYEVYNPEIAFKERVKDAESIAGPVIVTQDEMVSAAQNIAAARIGDDAGVQMIDNTAIIQEKKKMEMEQRKHGTPVGIPEVAPVAAPKPAPADGPKPAVTPAEMSPAVGSNVTPNANKAAAPVPAGAQIPGTAQTPHMDN